MTKSIAPASVFLLAALLGGCGREEIRVYKAPKEQPATRTSLPEGWEELPGDQMRVGNFAVHGQRGEKAQVSIIPLPGLAGRELENVNRWRGQLGLPPTTAAELPTQAEQVELAGEPAQLFDMAGVSPQDQTKMRIIAVMQNRGDTVWFFKMTGDDGLVAGQKPVFINFLAGYKYPSGPEATIPSSSPGVSGNAKETPARRTRWKVPTAWKEQPPGPMQDVKFVAADGKAVVTVSIFEGASGGMLANVNRWRAQIELAAVDEPELEKLLTPLDLPDAKAMLVDMKGPKQRLVAAIVPRDGSTWFFKLVGDQSAVGAEKDSFIGFVQSSK